MAMSQRQRAVAAIRGQPVDRIPFIGRMDLWYEHNRNRGTLPERYRGWSLWDIQRDLGIGIFGFGAWSTAFYRFEYDGVEVTRRVADGETVVEYVTPYGTLRSRSVLAEDLKDADVTGAQVEHEFKDERDYDALQYLFEHIRVLDNFDEYGKVVEAIGEDGLALPFSGWLPMHQIMRQYMGYETFYYELADRPQRVERLHEALVEVQRQIIRLGAQCPAEVIEVGANYDEGITPPAIYERYFLPFYREAAAVLHAGGKLMAAHADGEMSRLLALLADSGLDVAEAITPAPMTSIQVGPTRALWKDRLAMWGGIAAIMLTDTYSDAEFEAYMLQLFRDVAPGDRFILGFGDNAPTDALFRRIQMAAELYDRHGSYPLGNLP